MRSEVGSVITIADPSDHDAAIDAITMTGMRTSSRLMTLAVLRLLLGEATHLRS